MEELKHYLKVKNFGPLKDVEIDLTNKDLIVLIGPQASGKSTIAKLLGILMDTHKITLGYFKAGDNGFFLRDYFLQAESDYKISSYHKDNTSIAFQSSSIKQFELEDNKYSIRYYSPGLISTGFISALVQKEFVDLINVISLHGKASYTPSALDDQIFKFLTGIEDLSNRWIQVSDNQITKSHNALEHELADLKNLISNKNFTWNKLAEDLKELYVNFSKKTERSENTMIYVSSERSIIPLIHQSSFSFLKISKDGALPNHLLELGALYQEARKKRNLFFSSILNFNILLNQENEFLEINSTQRIPLQDAASGIQSLIPLEVVISANAESNYDGNIFIIEEPELNLYPSTQKKLVEFLIEKCTKNGNKLIITTHSPYILTALNNHITAHHVATTRPEMANEVAQKIPQEQWLDYDKVGAYYVAEGTAKNIMHTEHPLIDYSKFDEIADELGETYDSLIEMEYRRAN